MDRCEGGGARAISLARLTRIVYPCRAYTSKLNKNKFKKKTSIPIIVRCVHTRRRYVNCEMKSEGKRVAPIAILYTAKCTTVIAARVHCRYTYEYEDSE